MAKTAKQRNRAKGKAKNEAVKIGIIGGSGLYHMAGLTDTREVRVKTPFGDPSDAIVIGTLEGKRVAFLARHGRGHHLFAQRNQLSREYLRDEDAWRGTDYFGERGWIAAR